MRSDDGSGHTHYCPICNDSWGCYADDCEGIEEQVCAEDEGDYDEYEDR